MPERTQKSNPAPTARDSTATGETARPDTTPRFAYIVVAVDGSPAAESALDEAVALGARFGSRMTIVTVVPYPSPAYVAALGGPIPPPFTKEEIGYFRGVLKRAEERAHAGGIRRVATQLLEGSAVDQILGYIAREPPNLLVVGARGLSATGRFILGSVSTGLMHHATCPVLIHRAAPSTDSPAT